LKAFQDAKKIDPSVQVNLLLGECNVHLGNLLDTDDDQEGEGIGYYKEAVENFKMVRSLEKDALPDHFEEFLEEWEKDMEGI
jgi:hypothetical protein